MKNLTSKISLALFFGIIMLNAFGQTNQSKNSTPAKPLANNAQKADSDSTKKVVNSANKAAANGNKTNGSGTKTDTPAASASPALNKYIGKTYVFDQNYTVTECGPAGGLVKNPTKPVAIRGTRFFITAGSGNNLVILFYIWSLDKTAKKYSSIIKSLKGTNEVADIKNLSSAQRDTFEKNEKAIFLETEAMVKRKTYNFKNYWDEQFAPNTLNFDSLDNNRYYFLLPVDSLNKYCSPYKKISNWDINYGALVTTFKLRFNRFSFSNNLSVGGAVYYQKKLDSLWTSGFIGALSLSSVTLDPASTNLHTKPLLTASTTRPAFSPSVHYAITYKNINLTIGVGLDLLSKPTDAASATATNPEAAWIYNNKPWLGIGLGFNLFSNGTTKATSTDAVQQSPNK